MPILSPQLWLLAGLAGLMIGLSKTGLGGFGILAVALFALVLPTRVSIGYVLPLLVCADIVAVVAFSRHAVWKHIWRMFPTAAVGIFIGYALMQLPVMKSNDHVKELIGAIISALILFTYYRRARQQRLDRLRNSEDKRPPAASAADTAVARDMPVQSWTTVIATGVLAGVLTMVANASGPVMTLYLLAIGLPKMEFIGTGAYFFLVMNLFKVPFNYQLGLINAHSLKFDAVIAPITIAGALWGKWLISFLNQKLFENIALFFALMSGLWLLTSPFIMGR